MKRVIHIAIFISLAFFCAMPSFGQDSKDAVPDLSGTWILDKSEDLGNGITLKNSKNAIISDRLIIKQNLPEIHIAQKFSFVFVNAKGERNTLLAFDADQTVFTDARGETNMIEKSGPSSSITKWNGKKLLIIYYSKPANDPKKEKIGQIEIALSADKKVLTLIKKSLVSNGPRAGGGGNLSGLMIGFDFNNRKYIYKLSSN